MISASGAEGINLRNVRYVHILEPYWHPVRIEQVVGRARRICSHQDLPAELRTVNVFLYLMVYSQAQLKPLTKDEKAAADQEEADLLFNADREEVIGLAFAVLELISYTFLFSKSATRNDEYAFLHRFLHSFRPNRSPRPSSRSSRPLVANAAFLRPYRWRILFSFHRPAAQETEGA
jgi:hypothetical protein